MGIPTSRKTAGLATAHKSRVNAAQTSDKQDCLSHRVAKSRCPIDKQDCLSHRVAKSRCPIDKQDCLSYRVLRGSGYGPGAKARCSMRRSMKWVS